MKSIYPIILLVAFILMGCSSSKLVDEWKNPDTNIFEANKVLVIGIIPDKVIRRVFEQKLTSSLEKKGVIAVKSIDFFEQSFSEVKKTEKQLNEIEKQLFDAGFDAVLFATVTGSESKVTAVQTYKNLSNTLESFRDYYYGNQYIYYDKYNLESYQVYHTETVLYCVCPGKEREILWKCAIDIVDPQKIERSVKDYVKVLIQELEKQQLLIVN